MNKIETAITLPFAIDSTGNVSKTFDQNKIWADRVRSVIGTLKTERLFDANYGTKIPANIFEDFDTVQDAITREVTDSFLSFLPQLKLEEVLLTVDEYNNTVTADIVYSLPNKQVSTISVGIATLTGNNVINEVRL